MRHRGKTSRSRHPLAGRRAKISSAGTTRTAADAGRERGGERGLVGLVRRLRRWHASPRLCPVDHRQRHIHDVEVSSGQRQRHHMGLDRAVQSSGSQRHRPARLRLPVCCHKAVDNFKSSKASARWVRCSSAPSAKPPRRRPPPLTADSRIAWFGARFAEADRIGAQRLAIRRPMGPRRHRPARRLEHHYRQPQRRRGGDRLGRRLHGPRPGCEHLDQSQRRPGRLQRRRTRL